MNVLKWSRRTDGIGYETGDAFTPDRYVIERKSYGARYSFEAYHRGKRCGFTQSSLALAKRDAQQHANGFRGNVASTNPNFKAESDWCYCETEK